MLAIRMQRTGRKGHAQFRLIVQEARRSPFSGNVVASLGNYDPHSKAVTIDAEKAAFYLEHGAQPSPRIAVLLQAEGVKLPKWVKLDTSKKRSIKNVEKLRRNRPAGEEPKVASTEEPQVEPATEAPTEPTEEAAATNTSEETAADVETTKATDGPAAEPTEEAAAEKSTEEPAAASEPDIEKVAEEVGDDKIIESKPETEA